MGGRESVKGEFHRLTVLDRRAETKDATSVSFHVPQPLTETFGWRPGQHLTLRFRLDGIEERRPYSVSQSPLGGGPLRVTVKRIRGGLVSNHIHRNVTPGDVIDVMPPFGGFYLEPDARRRRTLYFFGAGSGITPLYAMLRSVLVAEPHSAVYLLYGNTDADAVIFAKDLSRLADNSAGRLTIRHVLSSPSRKSSLNHWRPGRINAGRVTEFIETHPPYAQDTGYYVCGPGDMNAVVKEALRRMDVPEERIHTENFRAVTPPDDSVRGVAAAIDRAAGRRGAVGGCRFGPDDPGGRPSLRWHGPLLMRVRRLRGLPGSPAGRFGPPPGADGAHRHRDDPRRHTHLSGPSHHPSGHGGIRLRVPGIRL